MESHRTKLCATDAANATDRYRRENHIADLAKLLPLWPKQIDDRSIPGRRALLSALERALRLERKRARAGHFAYDLARHSALVKIWRLEVEALAALAPGARTSGLKIETRRDGTAQCRAGPDR